MSLSQLNSETRQCVQDCQHCATTCLFMAANHCLNAGGKHTEPLHYRTMLDCAEICQTTANFMLRSSAHHGAVCRACAEVCESCAKQCESLGDMQECVEACRRCAESCRKMAST